MHVTSVRAVVAALSAAAVTWTLSYCGSVARAQDESPPRPPKARTVSGVIERIKVYPGDFILHAKVDTGADTSSLNAQDIRYVSRNNVTYVSFSVTNRDNRTATFERPLIRHVRIRAHGRPPLVRPVIMLGVCFGDVYRVTEVNLADRTGFNFQFLVGRRFMAQRIIVDPARQYITEPKCRGSDGKTLPPPLATESAAPPSGPSPGARP